MCRKRAQKRPTHRRRARENTTKRAFKTGPRNETRIIQPPRILADGGAAGYCSAWGIRFNWTIRRFCRRSKRDAEKAFGAVSRVKARRRSGLPRDQALKGQR